MKQTIRLMLEGGFHNSDAICVAIKANENDISEAVNYGGSLKELIQDNATEYQQKRLQEHFCGIVGCTCGSWRRARVWIK